MQCVSLLLMLTLALSANAGNILGLFPHFGYSHFKVFYPVMRALAENGHNVTVVTYVKSKDAPANYEEMLLTGVETVNVATVDEFTPTRSLYVMFHEHMDLHSEGQESCEHFYKSGFVERILARHKRTPFNLVVMEFFNTDCYLGVPYLLRVPVVGLSSCALMPWYYDRILLPDTPSHVQSEFVGFPEQLDWTQRLVNFVQTKGNQLLYRYHTNPLDNKLIKKYLNVDIDVYDFARKATSLIFVNQHYSLSGNRPLSTQLIEIGGVHVDEQLINQALPQPIADFLDEATEDVLLISWGSMLRFSSIEQVKLNSMLQVLQTLPLKIIWKWESDEKPIQSDKFLFVKWIPQLTLLCHHKVKLFWGHAGLLGVTEAVHCGKSMLLTPIYGDQFLNAHAVENRKTGVILHYNDIDKERLAISFQELLQSSYAKNAVALSDIFRNRIRKPLETTTWWIEHLLKHGPIASEVLRTKAVNLNWFAYYSLDSVAILLAGVIALIWLLLYAIRRICMKQQSKVKLN